MKSLLEKQIENSKAALLLLLPSMIFVGKFVRWTLMKAVLVDNSSGHEIIRMLIYGSSGKRSAVIATVPFYRLINIFDITTFTGYEIYLSILLNIILIALILRINRKLNVMEFVFYNLSFIVLNLFDFTLSKEPVQFLYFLLIFVMLVILKRELWIFLSSAGILLACGFYFRSYYFLMVLYFGMLYIFFMWCKIRKMRSWEIVIISVIGFTVFYFMILYISKHFSYSTFSELVRVRTRSSDAKTGITAVFPSNNLVLFSCNYIITLFRMMVPVELLRFGPKYYMYVLYQLFVTWFVVKGIININKLKKKQYIALLLLLAFILCSATFEPDFGSWVRHEALLLPIIMVILDSVKLRNDGIQEDQKKKEKTAGGEDTENGKTRIGNHTHLQRT